MSERDPYQAGIPCLVTAVLPDPEKTVAFYTELFDWEARETMGPDSPGEYFICTLHGRDVAVVGSERGGARRQCQRCAPKSGRRAPTTPSPG